jgi:hypothetical protein
MFLYILVVRSVSFRYAGLSNGFGDHSPFRKSEGGLPLPYLRYLGLSNALLSVIYAEDMSGLGSTFQMQSAA